MERAEFLKARSESEKDRYEKDLLESDEQERLNLEKLIRYTQESIELVQDVLTDKNQRMLSAKTALLNVEA